MHDLNPKHLRVSHVNGRESLKDLNFSRVRVAGFTVGIYDASLGCSSGYDVWVFPKADFFPAFLPFFKLH